MVQAVACRSSLYRASPCAAAPVRCWTEPWLGTAALAREYDQGPDMASKPGWGAAHVERYKPAAMAREVAPAQGKLALKRARRPLHRGWDYVVPVAVGIDDARRGRTGAGFHKLCEWLAEHAAVAHTNLLPGMMSAAQLCIDAPHHHNRCGVAHAARRLAAGARACRWRCTARWRSRTCGARRCSRRRWRVRQGPVVPLAVVDRYGGAAWRVTRMQQR
jgi:hypothetical protein